MKSVNYSKPNISSQINLREDTKRTRIPNQINRRKKMSSTKCLVEMDLTKGEEGEVTCDLVTPDHGGHVHIHDGDVQELYEESGGLSLDHPVLVMLTTCITIILFRVYMKRIGEKERL